MNGNSEIKIKKKRGRKPNITKNKDNMKNLEIEECFVIKITNDDKQNLNNEISFNINNFDIDEIKNEEKVKKKNISCKCWNCCHDFIDVKYGLPIKYINNIFYIYGDFCSFECSLRYGYEYLDNKNIYNLFTNVNLYKKKLFNNDKEIKMAPSKLYLQMFGGNLTIDEYRASFQKNDYHDIELQPIIPINHIFENYELTETKNKDNLKLFRTKKLLNEKKNIKNSMNLFNVS